MKNSIGPADRDRHLLGLPECQRLGNQFSQEYMEVGNQREGQRNSNRMCVEIRMGDATHPVFKDVGDHWLAHPSKGQTAQCYTKLDCRQKVVQIFLQTANRARAGHALGDHPFNARLANADQCKLCRHKETVGQNKQSHGDDSKEQKSKHFALRV